jgi:hypothetical protein
MRTRLLGRVTGLLLSPRTLLLTGLILLAGAGARADLVILKDGFTLRGKIKQQKDTVFDAGAGLVEIAKLNGFFMVDDGCRRMIFSHNLRQLQEVEDKDVNRNTDLVTLQQRVINLDNFTLPGGSSFLGITPFDDKWERDFKVQGPNGKLAIRQRLSFLSPQFAIVESLRYRWKPRYMTREFEPEVLHKLLLSHRELKPTGKPQEDAARRFRVYRFFVQANLYDMAGRELDSIAADFPNEKDKIEAARDNLRKLRTLQALDEVEQGHKAGRHQWVQDQLALFPTEGLDESQVGRLQTLRTQYETTNATLAQARRLLSELPARLDFTAPRRDLLTEAAAIIRAELAVESVGRLEAFLSLSQQAEKQQQANRKPEYGPDQLLALAVTGWLLGSGSSEAKVETAARLWRARQLVLDFQRTPSADARQRLLPQSQKDGLAACDELSQIIRHCPPPEPYPVLGAQWNVLANCWLQGAAQALNPRPTALVHWPLASSLLVQGASPSGAATLKLTTSQLPANLAFSRRRAIPYLLQLPPEYHHGRAYPLLFVLHQVGEKPDVMLARWSMLAAQNGYLLVAPEWEDGFSNSYEFTTGEHAAVLDVLKDLRRRFQVDSDRVFLFGWGEGGNMAYDVGLSHPDLFAGVLPMGGWPRYFARPYWRNAQQLPFYVIDGAVNGASPKDNRQQFQQWVPRGFPALYIEYESRGLEWFSGELPYCFDWMGRKKRATAEREVGRAGGTLSEEFQVLRSTDDRFYWLSVDGISDRNTNQAGRWRATVIPATLAGRTAEGNQVHVQAHGFRRVTVWLTQGMVDFDKNVSIYVNTQLRHFNRKVVPNLGTLLEDFYQRGDRQRLFWAKVEIGL